MNHPIDKCACHSSDSDSYQSGKRTMFGVALILIGGVFLAERMGYIADQSAAHYWPFILCAFGLNKLLFSKYGYRKIKGAVEIFLGFWIFACLEHLWGWTFSITWPMILIAFGLCYIASYFFKQFNSDNESAS